MPRSGPPKHSGLAGSLGEDEEEEEEEVREGTCRLKAPGPVGLLPAPSPGDVVPGVAKPDPLPVGLVMGLEVGERRLGGAGTERNLPCSSSRRMLQVAKDSEVVLERFSESLLWSFFCLVRRFWNQTLTWREGWHREGTRVGGQKGTDGKRARGGRGKRDENRERARDTRERRVRTNAPARPGPSCLPPAPPGTGNALRLPGGSPGMTAGLSVGVPAWE